jgi:hypothetical protein
MDYQDPIPGMPPSPVPTPAIPAIPMHRSVSSPGTSFQLPQRNYNTPQPSQYLNVNGYRFSPTIPSVVPTTIKPQNWYMISTGQNINADNFIAGYPMNVALPDALIQYMLGQAPAPSPSFLPAWMAKAQHMSRHSQPLANPLPAESNMISNIEAIDNTDFTQVPWTYMDSKYALPPPGPLPGCHPMTTPEPYQGMGLYVAAGM